MKHVRSYWWLLPLFAAVAWVAWVVSDLPGQQAALERRVDRTVIEHRTTVSVLQRRLAQARAPQTSPTTAEPAPPPTTTRPRLVPTTAAPATTAPPVVDVPAPPTSVPGACVVRVLGLCPTLAAEGSHPDHTVPWGGIALLASAVVTLWLWVAVKRPWWR